MQCEISVPKFGIQIPKLGTDIPKLGTDILRFGTETSVRSGKPFRQVMEVIQADAENTEIVY